MASIISASTTSATALNMTADTSGVLQIATGATPTTAVTIDTSQNVGIGVAPYGVRFIVYQDQNSLTYSDINNPNTGASAGAITRLISSNVAGSGTVSADLVKYKTGGLVINNNETNSAAFTSFGVGGAERMRIDSSGNVGIGTSSFAFSAAGRGDLEIAGSSTALVGLKGGSNQAYVFNDGTNVYVANASASGNIVFQPALNIERMRIDTNGYLLIGYTSSNGAYRLQVNSQIFATSATIATSDARYKTNVEPISSALYLVNQLNPVQFDWKEHPVHDFPEGKTIGFLAQEVEEVLKDTDYVHNVVKANECTITPEEKDEEGNVTKEAVKEKFLGIAEGNLIPLLTKAIQEQQTLITSLTERITALESK